MGVLSLGQEDPLEKEMETHSSIFAWEISWIEDLVGYSSWSFKRVTHSWVTKQQQQQSLCWDDKVLEIDSDDQCTFILGIVMTDMIKVYALKWLKFMLYFLSLYIYIYGHKFNLRSILTFHLIASKSTMFLIHLHFMQLDFHKSINFMYHQSLHNNSSL